MDFVSQSSNVVLMCINVIELSRLSKPEWNRQSYRVVTYYSEKENIMSDEFWPQDIVVRPFMRRRGETKSNNQKQ